MNIKEQNLYVMSLMSKFLNDAPTCIDGEAVQELSSVCGISIEAAYSYLLAAYCGIDLECDGRELFSEYFLESIRQIDDAELKNNAYYKSISFPNVKRGGIEFRQCKFKPFEAFVSDDTIMRHDGRIIPQIGFFANEVQYPSIQEDGRIWMTVTPLEINTIQPAIDSAHGHVLAYGLGLGYFAYMAARKASVETVTIVELNENVIDMFNEYLLPQFHECSKKITIIHANAFMYANIEMQKGNIYDEFSDLRHDVYDGEPLYLKMKEFEVYSPNSKFMYWIEKSILCHMNGF